MITAKHTKNGTLIELKGDPISMIIECHSICNAIAGIMKDKESTEYFIDHLSSDVRLYRDSVLKMETDLKVIRKAQEEN